MKRQIGVMLDEEGFAALDSWARRNHWARSHAARMIIERFFSWNENEVMELAFPGGELKWTPNKEKV